MNFNSQLANYLHISGNFLLPIEISIVILIFALIYYISWNYKITETEQILRGFISALEDTNSPGIEALNSVINSTHDTQLRNLLLETKDNLIEIEGDLGPEYFSLRNYTDIWTAREVLAGRMNLSLYETMPNILIGAGLMFTFMFLSFALVDAGVGMAGTNLQRDEAMKSLIANAGGKFITSIVGLLCSLTWNWSAKVKIDELQSCMYSLHSALRNIAPDTAAQAIVKRQHSIFKEMLVESRAQVGELRKFETDIAVAIAKAIGNELSPSFKTLGSELVDAINKLTEKISSMNEEALQEMISQFIQEFRGTSSAEMQEFKTVLTQLAINLNAAGTKIGTDIGTAGASFGTAASSLESAISKTQETVVTLDASLEKAGKVVSEGSDRFELVSDKLLTNLRMVDHLMVGVDAFIEKIQTNIGTLNNIADSLDDTVQSQRTITIEFKDAIPKMSKALSDAVLEISTGAKVASEGLAAIREELENTDIAVKNTVTSLTTGVDQYTDKVKTLHLVLDQKIGEAINGIGAAVNNLSEALDEIGDALPKIEVA